MYKRQLKAIVAWIIIFALYFVPYALMVGELGSAFKDAEGGVSSWIMQTIGPRMAYYAGWTYWVVHMPYISQKPNSVMIASSWAIFQDARISDMNPLVMQFAGLAIFLVALALASRGLSILKKLASVAGMASFVMSILYICLLYTSHLLIARRTPDSRGDDHRLPTGHAQGFNALQQLRVHLCGPAVTVAGAVAGILVHKEMRRGPGAVGDVPVGWGFRLRR